MALLHCTGHVDTLRDTESGAINGGQILRCGLGIQKWLIILFTYNLIIFWGVFDGFTDIK